MDSMFKQRPNTLQQQQQQQQKQQQQLGSHFNTNNSGNITSQQQTSFQSFQAPGQQQQQQHNHHQQPSWNQMTGSSTWAASNASNSITLNNMGSMEGNMDSAGGNNNMASAASVDGSGALVENEPPLLEELGINFNHIKQKVSSTLDPRRPIPPNIVDDADLAGPLIFCIALGMLLVLRGKLHFDYIYHFFVFGSLFMYIVLKLLAHRAEDDRGRDPVNSPSDVDVLRVFSILGYSLLPIVFLAVSAVILNLTAWYGVIIVILMIAWSTYTSTRFFVAAMKSNKQRYLIAYPVLLYFTTFTH
jgi:hypothetical protein